MKNSKEYQKKYFREYRQRESYKQYQENYQVKYRKTGRGKNCNRLKAEKYRHSEKGKKYYKKYRQGHKTEATKYQEKYKQTDEYKESQIKYWQGAKGRITIAKCKAKRKRNLGWILMFSNPFVDSALVDYHHITDVYVVAVPRELHRMYNGKQHREKVMEIVKQIYLGVKK